MKKSLCFLVALASISFSVLSMQVDIKTLRNYIKKAKQAEAQGNKQAALQWYGKVIENKIPKAPIPVFDHILRKIFTPSDTYKDKRKLQKDAVKGIANILRIYMKNAQQAENRGNKQVELQWYGKAANVNLPKAPGPEDRYVDVRTMKWVIPSDPYEAERELKRKAVQKITDEILRLKKEFRYDEALNIYQLAPREFANQIISLKKIIPFQAKLQKAKQLASQKKFTDAYKILDDVRFKFLPDIMRLKMSIGKEKEKWEKKKAPTKKKWIFLRKIDRPNKETLDWRIENKRLELKSDAKDSMTQYKLTELISDAQKKHAPYILIGLRKDWIYRFYDGSLLKSLGEEWKDPQLQMDMTKYKELQKTSILLAEEYKAKTVAPDVVEIYVVGEDGRPTFLMEIKQKEDIYIFFIEKKYDTVFSRLHTSIQMKKELEKSGYGHLFIAKLFNEAAVKGLEIRRFKEEIKRLKKEADLALSQHVAKFFEKIYKLREKIEKLSVSKKDPILQQHARQWFVWAIKYLKDFEHPSSSILDKAKQERDKIPNRPELLRAEREAPDLLIKNLQNMTIKLRQLSQKLR